MACGLVVYSATYRLGSDVAFNDLSRAGTVATRACPLTNPTENILIVGPPDGLHIELGPVADFGRTKTPLAARVTSDPANYLHPRIGPC